MTPNKLLTVLTLVLLACLGCTEAPRPTPSTTNGFWRQIGYGRILELSDSTIKVFDLNAIDCMLSFEEDILDFAEVVGAAGDTLTLKHGIDGWKCVRIDSLPTMCTNLPKGPNKDPLRNFDVFWQNFHEHYCSFELKGIDWDRIGEQYRAGITSGTSELELYTIFSEMIALLKDGHIKMDVPESIEDTYEAPPEKRSMFSTLDEFEISRSLAALYLDSVRSVNSGLTRWGWIKDSVGFVQINAMFMQANYDLPDTLPLQEFVEQYWTIASTRKDELQRQDEANGINATLNNALAELHQAKAIILDLRFNIGGKDGVAAEIVRHFSRFQGTMAKKYVHENGQFVNHQSITNTPSPNAFLGPVYVLTSQRTASAAELSVLCSLADKQITRIGSRTEGVFSSTLDKILPNGWAYEFSNEIYEDLNGKNYEHIGIAPDVDLAYPADKDAFFEGLNSDIKLVKIRP